MMPDLKPILDAFPPDFATIATQLSLCVVVFAVFIRQAWRHLNHKLGASAWYVAEANRLLKEDIEDRLVLAELKARKRGQEATIARLKEKLGLQKGGAPAPSSLGPAAPSPPPVAPALPPVGAPPLPPLAPPPPLPPIGGPR